jgi:hypothetical protein
MTLKTIAATLILLFAAPALADDACIERGEDFVSDYVSTWEVDFDLVDGTEDSEFYCWIGNINLDIAIEEHAVSEDRDFNFFTAVPKACGFLLESEEKQITFNCIQDVTLLGGEKVVYHRWVSLY